MDSPADTTGTSADATPIEAAPRMPSAGVLAVISLSVGAVGAALGATLVWFFLALPLGLLAVATGIADRRRRAAQGLDPTSAASTGGMSLGVVAMLLAVGGLLVVPRVEGTVNRMFDGLQGGVQEDLGIVERGMNRNVDALDATLTRNVDVTTQSLQQNFDRLEQLSSGEIDRAGDRVDQVVANLSDATGTNVDKVNSQLSKELATLQKTLRTQIATIEAAAVKNLDGLQVTAREELGAARDRIDSLETQIAALVTLLTELQAESDDATRTRTQVDQILGGAAAEDPLSDTTSPTSEGP